MEQYDAIKRKEEETGGALREAQTALVAATSAFLETEARRLDTFNRAFEHVCLHIDPIFKVPPSPPTRNTSPFPATATCTTCGSRLVHCCRTAILAA